MNRIFFTHQSKRNAILVLISLALSGCGNTQPSWDASPNGTQLFSPTRLPNLSSATTAPINPDNASGKQATAQIYPGAKPTQSANRGSTAASNHSNSDSSYAPMGGDIMLSFDNVPIREAARIILSDQLNQEYVVASEVQGNVSLSNPTGLAEQDLLPTLEVLLASIGAQLRMHDNTYHIEAAEQGQLLANTSDLQVIPLRFIDASEFAKLVVGYGVSATPFVQGNVLAVSGPAEQIKQVRELARSFDVNWLKGRSVGLILVNNTSALLLRDELLNVMGDDLSADNSAAVRIVAVERSNSIMVIANHIDTVHTVKQWVERLDQVVSHSDQAFFIYRVQNGRATDLAKLLRAMFGDAANSSSATELLDAPPDSGLTGMLNEPQRSASTFNVIADESTNSLIVTGSPHYYKAVRDAMQQLDSTPLQVLVEASIMELTLTDDLQYGLEWFIEGSRASTDISSSLDLGARGLGAIQPGFSYVLQRAGDIRAALNGLADDSRLKVLSAPSLMVLNNRTASILVGDEVPIPTRQAISNISPEAPTVNEIEYRNTGILLTVTPRVNSGGMVTMDISQEVSSVSNNVTSQIDAPTIQQRQINSTVSIQDGQSVVLGGLIRDQNSNRDAGVPLLKNIPGLGKLFSSTNTVARRTELVVLITPRVIANTQDTDAITEEFKSKMLGLRPLPLNKL